MTAVQTPFKRGDVVSFDESELLVIVAEGENVWAINEDGTGQWYYADTLSRWELPPKESAIKIDADPLLITCVLETVTANPIHFDMGSWHANRGPCGTTHCLAGWIVHLTPVGYRLEAQYSTAIAAQLILLAKGLTDMPNFLGTRTNALAWLRAESARELAAQKAKP